MQFLSRLYIAGGTILSNNLDFKSSTNIKICVLQMHFLHLKVPQIANLNDKE